MTAKHILACIDFSEHSKRALVEVGDYARTNGSKVTLIHVSDPKAFIPPQAVLEPAADDAPAAAREELGRIKDEQLSDLDVELTVLEDPAPAKAICDYAEANGVDLIVIGSQGHGGMERWLIGSVAERVVRHASANVYVIRQ